MYPYNNFMNTQQNILNSSNTFPLESMQQIQKSGTTFNIPLSSSNSQNFINFRHFYQPKNNNTASLNDSPTRIDNYTTSGKSIEKKRKQPPTSLEEQEAKRQRIENGLENRRQNAKITRAKKKIELQNLLHQQSATLELCQQVENYANIFRSAYPLISLPPKKELVELLNNDQKIPLCHERIKQVVADMTNEAIRLKKESEKVAKKNESLEQQVKDLKEQLSQQVSSTYFPL